MAWQFTGTTQMLDKPGGVPIAVKVVYTANAKVVFISKSDIAAEMDKSVSTDSAPKRYGITATFV